ncbi:MAG: response regulator [Anaerolineaceae bacterium]
MNIKILIADQLPIVRSGIINELNQHSDFEIVGEAIEGNETYFLVNKLKPDILLMDITMPGMKAVDIIRKIREKELTIRIIVITSLCDEKTIMELLQVGIDGYLLKNEDPSIISEAIYKVYGGDAYLSQIILSIVVEKAYQYITIEKKRLTDREKKVLDLLCLAKTNKEIADEIHISKRTVEFHVSNVLKKLGVRTRVEAIILTKNNREHES